MQTFHYFFLSFVCLFFCCTLQAQSSKPSRVDTTNTIDEVFDAPPGALFGSYFEISTNFAFNQGSNIGNIFDWGNGVSVRIPIHLLHDRLFIRPAVHSTYFVNYYNASVQDNLWQTGVGVGLAYYWPRLSDKQRLVVYPALEVKYNWVRNVVSPRIGYSGDALIVATGGGMSYMLGGGITWRRYFVEGGYSFFNPTFKPHSQLIDDLNANTTGLYEPYNLAPTKVSTSYWHLAIGINMPLW